MVAMSDDDDLPAGPISYTYEEIADTPNSKLLRTSQVNTMAKPDCYRSNSQKEELMLEYVRHFERQFENLYPKRRPLLLAPRNECGMRKFICTSLRPTQLPYQDLYDYDKCAKFVADFITYEPLELATSLPQHMPSPSAVIEWQAGDCFDMAQLLCSLLLGVGYDAYVVSGYARCMITHCDQSTTGYNMDGNKVVEKASEVAAPSKYAVPPRRTLESNFVKQKAEREASSKAPNAPADSNADSEVQAGNEAEELDELKGRRVHAWVMLLAGKRLLEQILFIEPSTGTCFTVEQAPYYTIESVWNSSNYWVNLQAGQPLGKLSFDLTSTSKWEYMLFDATMATAESDDNEDSATERVSKLAADSVAAEAGDEEKIQIDMPPSWVTRLHVPRDLFQARCPAGHKTIVYRKGLLEKFAPYSREDGLVEQVKIFEDVARTEVMEVRQMFANRKDKLSKRVIRHADKCTHEFFDPGRLDPGRGLKELIYMEGVRREYHFYASARLDGLITRIEDIGKKTLQIFDGSKDSLTYRSVSYHASDGESEPQIRKMAEKFKRTPALDAEEDVAKRTFDMAGGTIKVRYHYGHDRVTASFRTYAKDGSGHNFVQVDPFARPLTDAQLLEEYTKLQTAERECINEIRDADRKAKDILKKREEEESDIIEAEEESAALQPGQKPPVPAHLTVSVYDTARSKLATTEEVETEQSSVPHDYLTPFLVVPIGPNDAPLSREEALQARDACLRSLKDRLVERANIVQSRLDEENAALSKRQAAFSRNRDHMDPSDEAEYERYAQEAMFRIQILEQRLDRHTELSLAKYAEMDARLRKDPRLRALAVPSR